jgi:SAM-dependent methyltransferase
MRDSPLARYHYVLCHGCGVVYAVNRPVGDELRYLYAHFNEYLGRAHTDLLSHEGPLTPEQKAEVRRRLAAGRSGSDVRAKSADLGAMSCQEPALDSYHVNILASHCSLRGARILHMRTTCGATLDTLRQHYGATSLCAMTISEMHRFIITELNPMPCAMIDFETLEIPFDELFDLIIANHILTHAQDPQRFFATLRSKLRPNGWICLYLENDDINMFRRKRKNLICELKCFHFQHFDVATLGRILSHQGFQVEHIGHPRQGQSEIMCLARLDPSARPRAIERAELEQRQAMYRQWRDMSVLSCPPEVQVLWGPELKPMRQRALKDGYAEMSGRRWFWGWGRNPRTFTLKKPLRIMHEDGYKRLNTKVGAEAKSA